MSDTRVSWSEITAREYLPALALVCLGVWLHAADGLVVSTMLPSIVAEIGGQSMVSWSVALYEVGTIISGTAGGLLTIRYGLRLPMAVAALLFAAGCAVCAVAPSMPVLLASRLLQGFGGGGLMALAFVAVGRLFPERLIPRAIASMSALWGASAFLGPLIGGLFVEYATWRSGFAFFGLQAAALSLWIGFAPALRGLRKPAAGGARSSFPIRRLAVLAAGILLIAYAGIEISVIGTPLFVVAGLLCFALFLAIEARAGDNRLFPHRPFGTANAPASALTMIVCFSAATVPFAIFGPILLIALHGVSVLTAGYIVAASSVGWTLAAVSVSGFNERHDARFIAAGIVLVAASVAGLAVSVADGPLWLVLLSAIAEGGGFGMAWTFILRRAAGFTPAGDLDRLSSAMPTAQRIGYAVGAAYVGIVANASGFATATDDTELAHAATWIFLGCVPPALAGLYAALRFVAPGWAKQVPVSLGRSEP